MSDTAVVTPEGERQPARREAVRSGPSPRTIMWLFLLFALMVLPFFSLPGRYSPDTRDATWFSPTTDLFQQFTLWKSSPYLGLEQHTGIIVPMGTLVALLRGAGLSLWVAERLWHGLLLFTAGAGTVLLVDQLRGRRTVVAPLSAALVFALTPYTFGYGLPTTGAYLPYVLLPWLLLVTARGLGKDHGLAAPAVFGLTVFLMGGGNGAPQVYALLTVLLYGLWVVGVERSVPVRRALRFAGWSALFGLFLNAYWLVLLASSTVGNVLAFSEQPKVINVASSYSESIRGLGFWAYYGGDASGPWVPTAQRFLTSPVLVLTGFAVPIGALVSAWLVRWRFRLFFLFLAILSVVVMAGIFPVSSPTPFGHLLQFLYDHVPGAAGLRTTYKFGGTLALSLAVLVGVGLEEAWPRARAAARPAWRLVVAGLAVAVIAANAVPLWTGGLYAKERSVRDVPEYWREAIRYLDGRDGGYRVFFAPRSAGAAYRWGDLHDGIAEAFPELSTVHPPRVPVGERYGSNLLVAVEQPYQGDVDSSAAAVLFRYLGVRDVVLQNDLDWQRDRTARPAELQALVKDGSLEPEREFGGPGEYVLAAPPPTGPEAATARIERGLYPVQVLGVPGPLPVVRADARSPVILSGDGFGVATAARMGLLDGNPPVLYSGALGSDQLDAVAADLPSFVITDSNRRRAWSFSAVRHGFSSTLAAGETLGGRTGIAYGLFGGRTGTQSVAEYEGVRSITASASGSSFDPAPQFRPSNAFDGDPATWWLVGGLSDPVGQWVQVAFDRPRTISRVNLSLPRFAFGFGSRVKTARIEFSDGTSLLAELNEGTTEVTFSPRETAFLRVRIASVARGAVDNRVGFTDIGIPGVRAVEAIRLPVDLFSLAARSSRGAGLLAVAPLTYLFDRARTDVPLGQDEEREIRRIFEVPAGRHFVFRGIVHLDTAAADDAIDRLLVGDTDVVATSSSRYLGGFAVRASQALDGRDNTAWIPQKSVGESMQVAFPEHRIGRIEIHTQRLIGRSPVREVEVRLSDGTLLHGRADGDGVIVLDFPSVPVSSVRIKITDVVPVPGNPPVGISEVVIPGVHVPIPKPDRALPCVSGPGLTLDGTPLSVRVEGTAEELLSGRDLAAASCEQTSFFVSAGRHELVGRGPLQPDTLVLSTASENLAATPPPPPDLEVRSARAGGYDVDVHGGLGPFYLVIGQNYSTAWRASVDGKSLGPPLLLDGYSAGWRIDRTGSFRVAVRFPPQRRYDLALAISGIALLAVLVLLAGPAIRRGRRTRKAWRARRGRRVGAP